MGDTPGAPASPREAWPVVSSPSWRAEPVLSSQVVSTPSSMIAARRVGHALVVVGRGAQAAGPVRVVDDVARPAANTGWPSLSLRKELPRATAGPAMAPTSGREQGGGEAVLEDHRRGAAVHLARAEPGDGAPAGLGPDLVGRRAGRPGGGRGGRRRRAPCPRRRSAMAEAESEKPLALVHAVEAAAGDQPPAPTSTRRRGPRRCC